MTDDGTRSSTPSSDSASAKRETALRIATLLSHYWTAEDGPEARLRVIADWVAALAEFGPLIVQLACARWRNEQTKRPTPAEIRDLCEHETEHQRKPRAPLITQAMPDAFPSAEHFQWLKARLAVAERDYLPKGGRADVMGWRQMITEDIEAQAHAYHIAWLRLEWGDEDWRRHFTFGRKYEPPAWMIDAAYEHFCLECKNLPMRRP